MQKCVISGAAALSLHDHCGFQCSHKGKEIPAGTSLVPVTERLGILSGYICIQSFIGIRTIGQIILCEHVIVLNYIKQLQKLCDVA